MKKVFILLAALIMCCRLPVGAQSLKIGVRGGVNNHITEFSPLRFGDITVAPSGGYQLGYQAAAVLRISMSRFLHIQPEIVYSQTRSRLLLSRSVTTASRMTLSSLDVPVTVGLKIGALRLFAGPVFRLTANLKAPSTIYEISGTDSNDNLGLQAGAGLDIGKFFIDARYGFYADPLKFTLNVNGVSRVITADEDKRWEVNVGFFF